MPFFLVTLLKASFISFSSLSSSSNGTIKLSWTVREVRDALIDRGLSVLSVRRIFTTVKAVINLAIAEHGLDIRNAFAAIYMPEAESKKRVSIPVETIG